MKELFGILAFFALLWVAGKTEIPAKAAAATERWLDGSNCAARDSDAMLGTKPEGLSGEAVAARAGTASPKGANHDR